MSFNKRNNLAKVDLKNVCPNYLNNQLMMTSDYFCASYENKFIEKQSGRVDVEMGANSNHLPRLEYK